MPNPRRFGADTGGLCRSVQLMVRVSHTYSGCVVASATYPDVEPGFESFELLLDAVLAVDQRGVIRYANYQASQLFRQAPATLISAQVETVLPEHLRERHIAHRAKYTSELRTRTMGAGLDLVARMALRFRSTSR